MPRRAFKIPLAYLLPVCTALIAGEVFCGTNLWFATAMGLTMFFAAIAYNIFGGFSTLSGIAFTALALRSFVISQFAKVLLRQPADSPMQDPTLTATVYLIFFGAVMLGAFVFRQIRFGLPRAKEPETDGQLRILYVIALALGTVGEMLVNLTYRPFSGTEYNSTHSAGIALMVLLSFALVLGVELRLRKTGGRHTLGLPALLPSVLIVASAMINDTRQGFLEPILIYVLTCFCRGYRFRMKHYLMLALSLPVFVLIISPLELYTRGFLPGSDFQDRVVRTSQTAASANWKQIEVAENAVSNSDDYEDYYMVPGTTVLSRLSRIRMDSNLIATCRTYHYGFAAVKQDLLLDIPRVLMKDKPQNDSGDFLGKVSGVSADFEGITEPAFTPISDAFGGFGFAGVVFVGLFLLPLTFSVYEGMFTIERPWGTIALVGIVMSIAEGGLGRLVADILLRTPVYLFALSYISASIVRMVPASGDRRQNVRSALVHAD